MIRKLVVILLLLVMNPVLWVPGVVHAACGGSGMNLTAPTWADLQLCLNAVAGGGSGETITVTPGTYSSGSAQTTTSKYVKINLTGVTVTNDISGSGVGMLEITDSSAGHTEVYGFTFNQGTSLGSYMIMLRCGSGGRAALIHDFTLGDPTPDGNLNRFGARTECNRGVWYNVAITAPVPLGYGMFTLAPADNAWSTASTMGTNDTTGENNTYVEDFTFTNYALQVIDLREASKNVFRHGTFFNSAVASHGLETGNPGHRHTEFYNNVFTLDQTGSNCPGVQNMVDWIQVRGGVIVVTDNTITDLPMRCSFAGTAPSITLTAQNLMRRYDSGPSSPEINNPCWNVLTSPGSGYPVPQQVGQGNDGSHSLDGFGSTHFVEGVYVWNNTSSGAFTVLPINFAGNECGVSAPDVSGYIQSGRDYFLSAKSGYTKYPYPHPLRNSAALLTTTIRGPVTIRGAVTVIR